MNLASQNTTVRLSCLSYTSLLCPLDSTIGTIVEERFVCHTMTYDLRGPPLDLGRPVLALPDDDSTTGRQGGVLIEEVEGAQEEAHSVTRCCGVGDVLRVRHVQEAHRYPGNQVLHR